jgi:molybdopterin converting factor small subunit
LITVRCLGHIGSTLGSKELTFAVGDMEASDLVERLRASTGLSDPGFSKFNTLVMVEDGEAFVPAGANQTIRDGARVVLIPFSHGG